MISLSFKNIMHLVLIAMFVDYNRCGILVVILMAATAQWKYRVFFLGEITCDFLFDFRFGCKKKISFLMAAI